MRFEQNGGNIPSAIFFATVNPLFSTVILVMRVPAGRVNC